MVRRGVQLTTAPPSPASRASTTASVRLLAPNLANTSESRFRTVLVLTPRRIAIVAVGSPLQAIGEIVFPFEDRGVENAIAVTVWSSVMLVLALGLAALARRAPLGATIAGTVLAALTLVLFYFTAGPVIFGVCAWFLCRGQQRGGRVAGLIGGLLGLVWTVASIAWWISQLVG